RGRTLREPTSGTTAHSLAMIAKLKGYPLTCVMPEDATEERKRLLRLYGAEVVLSAAADGADGAGRLVLAQGAGGRGLDRARAARAREARERPSLVRPLPVRERGDPARALRGHGSRDR